MAVRMRGLLAGLWVGACPIDRGTPGVKNDPFLYDWPIFVLSIFGE